MILTLTLTLALVFTLVRAQDDPSPTTQELPDIPGFDVSELDGLDIPGFNSSNPMGSAWDMGLCGTRGIVCQMMNIPGEDMPCFSYECLCALYGTNEFRECIERQCGDPDDVEVYLWQCETMFGLPTTGTPVNDVDYQNPTLDVNVTAIQPEDDGLSRSDKIAIGIGVGFGVPTLGEAIGAWLCTRQRRARNKTMVHDQTLSLDSAGSSSDSTLGKPTADNQQRGHTMTEIP